MNGRTKLLGFILITILLISVIGVVLYSQNRTTTRTHASIGEQPARTPFQPESQYKTQNALSLSDWQQDNVTQDTDSSIVITSPPQTNWFYVKNNFAEYNLNDSFSVDFTVTAHSLNNPTIPAIAHIHLVNNIPLMITPNKTPPDEIVLTKNENNKLLVSVINFSQNTDFPKIDLVKDSDNITFPESGHIKFTVSGINSGQELITIYDGDTALQLTKVLLPFSIFNNRKLFLELSVQNAKNDLIQATMKVSKLSVTN